MGGPGHVNDRTWHIASRWASKCLLGATIWLVSLGILVLIVVTRMLYLRTVGEPEERFPAKHASVTISIQLGVAACWLTRAKNKHTPGSSWLFVGIAWHTHLIR